MVSRICFLASAQCFARVYERFPFGLRALAKIVGWMLSKTYEKLIREAKKGK
jgi:hypothetical protein